MIDHAKLGQLMRIARLRRGLNRFQAYMVHHVTPSCMRTIESGRSHGHIATLATLADAYGFKLSELIRKAGG